MTNEEKNHKAYDDCANFEEPTLPEDGVYMKAYQYWRSLAGFPEDKWEEA